MIARQASAAALAGVLVWLPARAAPAQEFPPGTRGEIDGRWADGVLEIEEITQEEPDEHSEIKGNPRRIDVVHRLLVIGPFAVEVPEGTDIRDDEKKEKAFDFDDLVPEWRLKVEGELVAPLRFRALDIRVDRKPGTGRLELEGFVEEERVAEDGTRVLRVLGVECRFTSATVAAEGVFRKVRRRRQVNRDEVRPDQQLEMMDRLTIGGEVQTDFELRDDYDLDKHQNEDTATQELSAILEATLDLGRIGYAFGKVRSAKSWVIFDEKRDLHLEEATVLEELYFYWDLPEGIPLGLQLGRQDFDEPREWLYDENLDAARVYYQWQELEIEYSWSTLLADEPRDIKDRVNQILFARWGWRRDSHVGAYFIDIRDESDLDDSPFFLGARLLDRGDAHRLWLDYSYLDGVLDTAEVEAHGGDAGAGWQFEDWPLAPYVFASYAFGSGDDKASGDTSREFRQTGYNDNTARVFGVASYEYYGELFRPELSNMHIYSAGLGMRPLRWFSADLVYHWYEQDHASTSIRSSRLRASPSGASRELGEEIDLVLGFDKLAERVDIEVDLGYFLPGDAFGADDHPALWVAVQVEWNF